MGSYQTPKMASKKWGGTALTGGGHKGKIVSLQADGEVQLCGAGAQPWGVLHTDGPIAVGQFVEVIYAGGALVKCAGTINGAVNVASDASGLAVAAVAEDWIVGQLEEAGVANGLSSLVINILELNA
jgi:hypothetical protein